MIWVADCGFTSAENRRHLTAGGSGYILDKKLRPGSPEALARQGRYQEVRDNLRAKEVKVGDATGTNERFVICRNPDAATRDAAIRR